jgi:pimeloyl-ACP methyl ester carboxylesterase
MEVLWPQLWEVDLREQAPRLEVSVYLLEGRHDVNTPPALAEDYLSRLEAPRRELIWFEHSGHSPWVEEPERVIEVMVHTVLGQSTP